MKGSPHTRNYLYGKGELFFRATGSDGYDHLGNAPAFTISLAEEKLEHFSSMSGTKTKDLQLVTQKGATVAFTLEEFSAGNILRAFKGAALSADRQEASVLSAQAVSVNDGLYTLIGKENLGFTRFDIGALSGAFTVGSTVTGATSKATATVAFAESGCLECVSVSGTFVPGETLQGGSGVSAVLRGFARIDGVVLTDKAVSPTRRYRQGADYDLNARTGLLRVNGASTGVVYVTADCEACDARLVDALTASDVTGELLFVGQPDQGPGIIVQCWSVALSLSGEVGLVSEELASLPMSGEVLADERNHPESPFFRVRYLG